MVTYLGGLFKQSVDFNNMETMIFFKNFGRNLRFSFVSVRHFYQNRISG